MEVISQNGEDIRGLIQGIVVLHRVTAWHTLRVWVADFFLTFYMVMSWGKTQQPIPKFCWQSALAALSGFGYLQSCKLGYEMEVRVNIPPPMKASFWKR